MDVKKEDAKAALDEINDLVRSTKQRLAHGPAGLLLVIWGLIWFVSFLGGHLQPRSVNWLPILGCAIGMASLWIVRRRSVQTRGSTRSDDPRIRFAWLILTAYAILWMFILHPQRQPNAEVGELIDAINHVFAFFATVGMFGYVVAGLWFGRFLVILGLVVTSLILIGLYAIPQWFLIWMAFVGGGALVFSGLMVKRLWAV